MSATMPGEIGLSNDGEDRFFEIIADYLDALGAGQAPDRWTILSAHPELASELTEFFIEQDDIRAAAEPLRQVALAMTCRNAQVTLHDLGSQEASLEPGLAATLDALGYDLIGEIARGGIGIVYKARQRRPNRLVAVKTLGRGWQVTPIDVARFRNECETLGELFHPHIVPVYEIAEQGGQLFLCMQFLEGGTLADRVANGAVDPWWAAALVRDVALAIHEAHLRGILHRDLKPSNILLDREGRPHVSDFGLAKRVTSPSDHELTNTRAIVGTPSYMAPEQTLGQKGVVTTAADIYGLGAILYALLAGQAPFSGNSVLDTLQNVRTQEPVAPRQFNRQVPRDLETIVLKCLAKEPTRRYASASLLAEDLNRFLSGRSILARPATASRRFYLWARRRPALAAVILVTTAAALLVAGLLVRHGNQMKSALELAEASASEARIRKEQVTTNYREARETIERMLQRSAARQRSGIPRLVELWRDQQEDALQFLLTIAKQQSEDPEVLSDVAFACQQAAKLQLNLGKLEEARQNFTRSRDLLQSLIERNPRNVRHREQLAYVWMALGTFDGDRTSLSRALTQYEELLAEGAEVGEGLAKCYHNLGHHAFSARQVKDAEAYWRKSLQVRLQLRPPAAALRAWRMAIAQTQLNLSQALRDQKSQTAEAEELHHTAATTLEQLVQEDESDVQSVEALAILRVNWAYVLMARNELEAAEADLRKNVVLLTSVLHREPLLASVTDALLKTYGVRATVFEQLHKYAEAVSDYEQVVALSPPTDKFDYRVTLATLRVEAGDHVKAFEEAEALAQEMPAGSPWIYAYSLAKIGSHSMVVLEKEPAIHTSRRQSLADRYSAFALQMLAKARAAAPAVEWQAKLNAIAVDFRPLVNRPAFQDWLKAKPSDLQAPVKSAP